MYIFEDLFKKGKPAQVLIFIQALTINLAGKKEFSTKSKQSLSLIGHVTNEFFCTESPSVKISYVKRRKKPSC